MQGLYILHVVYAYFDKGLSIIVNHFTKCVKNTLLWSASPYQKVRAHFQTTSHYILRKKKNTIVWYHLPLSTSVRQSFRIIKPKNNLSKHIWWWFGNSYTKKERSMLKPLMHFNSHTCRKWSTIMDASPRPKTIILITYISFVCVKVKET